MAPLGNPESSQVATLRIAVLGGGVVGIASGLALQQEYPSAEICIIAEKWTPQTTGNVSAGFIFPYAFGDKTPPEMLKRILNESVQFWQQLIRNPSSGQFGISLLTCYDLSMEDDYEVPDLPELIHVRAMNRDEVGKMFPGYRSGVALTTYVAEPSLFLPFFMEKFQNNGGKFVTQKVSGLSELTPEYDLVINCTGIGARFLEDVKDTTLEAARGQVIRVRAPWIRHAVMTDTWYIFPNRDCVVLGGTKEHGNYNLSPDPETAATIFCECVKLIPSLAKSEKIADCVGLRPYRPSLRIEIDPNNPKVIHNYGHGGSGVTLSWGSAVEVVKVSREALTRNGLKAKL